MTGPLLLLALAATSEILLPPWPLSPDGELVAVRGGTPLAAEGAAVEPVAPGLHRVTPEPGVATVELSSGGAKVSAAVEPPPGEIAIEVNPPSPVKGKESAVAIEVVVRDGSGADAGLHPPEIVCSSGRVRDLAPAGPGRFTATYEPAPTRHPEVAVLLALAPRCPTCATPRAVGYAVIPLAAAIDLPGRSEPGARTTVTLGVRSFGPVLADEAGRFTVPVVVPPGVRYGIADSVDQIGNLRRTEIDLRLPAVDRLACTAWPRALPADGRSAAAVWCVASRAGGEAAPDARLSLSAPAGELSATAPFRGALQRAVLRAPRGGGGRDLRVAASYPDGGPASADEIRVRLATGPPAEIAATVHGEPVPLGATVAAEAIVRDGNGDVVGRAAAPPGQTVGFVAPDRFTARAEAGDYVQRAPLVFALAAGSEVATLSLRREGGDWVAAARSVDARPAAGATLRFGSGVTATTDGRGEARVHAAGPSGTVAAGNGARAAGFEGAASPVAPFEIARTVPVGLRPPSPVDVTARVEDGYLRWRIADAAGRPLPGRAVALRGRGVDLGPVESDAEGGRAKVRGGRGAVAVIDAATGIGAVVEVP
jgi:hypothetical protein